MIAAALSGCVQEVSEIGTPGVVPEDATQLSVSAPPQIMNWEYVSYRNLSISNAPALNQTARVAYSIVPDRDIEDLLVYISFLDGFEIVEVEGERILTRGKDKIPYRDLDRCARWRPTDLKKGELYQFAFVVKAVKTGNWTITGLDWEDQVYVSVSENSAYVSDKPFPKPFPKPVPMAVECNWSELEKIRANMITAPSKCNHTPRPINISGTAPPWDKQ